MRTVNFFATPQELVTWVETWSQKHGLHRGVVAFQPRFELTVLNDGERLDSIWKPLDDGGSRLEELWLSVTHLNAAGATSTELRGNNRDCLIIALPQLTDSSIQEACVGTVSQDSDRLKLWKKLVSELKRQKTDAGMWILNRQTRIKRFYKDFYYSPGAAALSQRGVRLLTMGMMEASIDEPRVM